LKYKRRESEAVNGLSAPEIPVVLPLKLRRCVLRFAYGADVNLLVLQVQDFKGVAVDEGYSVLRDKHIGGIQIVGRVPFVVEFLQRPREMASNRVEPLPRELWLVFGAPIGPEKAVEGNALDPWHEKTSDAPALVFEQVDGPRKHGRGGLIPGARRAKSEHYLQLLHAPLALLVHLSNNLGCALDAVNCSLATFSLCRVREADVAS